MNNNIWIIGCGDIGRRVAKIHQEEIQGIVQSIESSILCKQQNIKTLQLNFDDKYTLDKKQFLNAKLYYFMPPPSNGLEDTRLREFLLQVASQPKRIILISTTGVYGDSNGEWIDELTAVNPTVDRAHRRLSAEKSLKQWAKKYDKEFIILRVPGIYAQDRLPLARLEKELPVVNEAEAGFTNRIHADDLAMVCKAAMESQLTNEIINVTDGHPSTMTEYFNSVADYSNLPRPPQISMQEAQETLSAGMVSYLKESRRIGNDKMLKLLKVTLKYPTLSSALQR